MVDTVRTLAEILTLLADNSAGDISPQDIRDAVVSLEVAEGGIYISTPVETVIATVSTPVKVLGTTTLATGAQEIDMPANNRIRYTGAAPKIFAVDVSMSFTVAANNKVIGFYLAKNGSVVTETKIERKVGTGADVGAISLCDFVSLSLNDYIEVFVVNETDDENVTVTLMTLVMTGHAT